MSEKDTPFERFRLAGASEQQLQMLKVALHQAPELNVRVTKAMQDDDLTRINTLPTDGNRGEYSGYYREIRFASDLLDAKINQRGVDRVVDVFSHEIEHALRREEMQTFDTQFRQKASAQAEQPGQRDATALVKEYIDKGRQQESLAELGGINGLADRMRAEGRGAVTENNVAKRLLEAGTSTAVERDDMGGYRFKQGIKFDAETQSVPANAQNLEAIGKHFFDIDRGAHSYKPFYAAAAIGAIAQTEFAQRELDPLHPQLQTRIDLAALGVNAADLRKQEFNLGINPPGPFGFIDTSRGRNQAVEVADTVSRKPGAPEMAIDPTHPQHRDHDAFQRLFDGIQADGRWDKTQAANIAGALLLESRRDPLIAQVDDMAIGPAGRDGIVRAYALRKPHGDKDPIFHAEIDTAKAAGIPAQDSFAQLQVVNQHLDMERQREQAQKHDQERQRQQNPDGAPGPAVIKH